MPQYSGKKWATVGVPRPNTLANALTVHAATLGRRDAPSTDKRAAGARTRARAVGMGPLRPAAIIKWKL